MRISVIFLVILLLSCSKKQDAIETNNTKTPIWSQPLSDGSDYIINMTSIPIYENIALFPGIENNIKNFNGLDINTGNIIWQTENTDGLNAGIRNYSFQDNAYFDNFSKQKSIKISTGATNWNFDSGNPVVSGNNFGIDHTLYVNGKMYKQDGNHCSCVYSANLNAADSLELIVCPEYSFNYAMATGLYGSIGTIYPFIENGDTLLFIGFSEAEPINRTIPFWGLYNQSKKQWEIERNPVGNSIAGFGHSLFYYLDKFYFSASRGVYCFDRYNGEEIWHKDFQYGFSVSGLLLIEEHGILLGTNQDKRTYSFNLENGDILWETETASTGSIMYYQDDIAYFTGGSTGKLHALDIHTGELLWAIESPDLKNDDFAVFSPQINGIPAKNGEKGKIFVSSFLSAFCFEAIN